MIFKNYFYFLCILFVSIVFCDALYEDQVGKFDWKLSFVGDVIHSKIELDGKTPKVYVATENNIVAAINAKNGNIIWRHLLESGEEGIIQTLYVGNEVVTVSGSGPFMVRGWNKSSGLQLYEWSSPATLPKEGIWTVDQLKVYQVRIGSNTAELTGFHAKSGNPAGSTKTISSPWISSPERCTLLDGALSCLSAEGNGMTSMMLADLSVKSGALSSGPGVVGMSSVGQGVFIGKAAEQSKVAVFDSTGALASTDVPTKSAVTVHKSTGGTVVVQISKAPKSPGLDVEYTVIETNKKSKFTVTNKFPLARPVYVSAYCNLGTDGEPNCLALVSMVDEAVCLIQKGNLLWVREEALANVIGVELVDLPVSDEEAALETKLGDKGVDSSLTSGVIGMLTRRLSSQVLHLHSLLSAILGLIDPSIGAGESRQLVKDSFGLHKLILLSTKSSKIFAIDNEDGEIIWQKFLRSVTPLKSVDDVTTPIFILRSARHIPYSTMASILFKERKTGHSILYVFDPITGSTSDGGLISLGKKVLQCMRLPEPNDQFISGLLLLMEGGDVQVYPPSTNDVALRMAKKLFMYTVDPSTGIMIGYNFRTNPQKPEEILSRVMWNLRLPEKLVSVAGKRREEKVHSQGRVLGDRSVLYKYVNPNLIAAATVTPDPVLKSIVSVYLIDAVSGGVVFSTTHKRASEPVHLVHSENWIAYSFFSEKSRRTEIITLDLYEGDAQRNTTAFSSLDAPIEPLIERQAYIFPHNIVTMKETITEKGITSKHVLLALSSGGVMEMPWVLLDPRRSVAPTPEMREEGIVPYIPELGLPHEAIITYNHTLEDIRGIHTSPSGLESTCLVFIYGLDLFYTRVTPSKTFDVLKDDFEYWLITAVLSGLVTAAYVTKRLASRKALMLAWK
uniref:ER membrane protein complex subunit 1 n=1 Tax=Lygus hesperus TaxID=30085 RepID=A0A0K8T908_LYGHE